MKTSIFDFSAVVFDSYRWVPWSKTFRSGTKLHNFNLEPQGKGRRVNILENHPALFRTFADLVNQEEIISFALSFGLLRYGETIHFRDSENPEPNELFSYWKREIAAVRTALALWDAAREQNFKELKKIITSKVGQVAKYTVSHPKIGCKSSGVIAGNPLRRDRIRHTQPGGQIHLAQFAVSDLINKHIRGRASPVARYDGEGSFSLEFKPHSLAGALWLQLAQSVNNNTDFRGCSECGTWIEIRPPATRETKQFCSNACKQKAYRKRRVLQ